MSEAYKIAQEPEKTLEWNCKRMAFQRKKAKLSRNQLAGIMGVSHTQIECMEKCTRIPSKELLDTLVSFFDVPGDYFGVEALDGRVNLEPSQLSPQDERQQAAKASLAKQRKTLRKMMKKAGFPLNCTGLHCLAEAIDESISDTCKYANGELALPPDTVNKVHAWFSSIHKKIRTTGAS